MVPARPSRRRIIPSTLLALLLAVGTVAGAVARDGTTPAPSSGMPAQAVVAGAVEAAVESAWIDPEPQPRYDARATPARPTRVAPAAPADKPAAAPVRKKTAKAAAPASFRGRNHVWMPAIKINRSVARYACSNKSYPGDRVYRWGCAGRNNVYLFGHAHSVFKKLHDAYVRGSLKKGMKLYYADGKGKVHTYKLAWWKVTTPTKGTWAYKSQSRPSLTLQTCVGAKSQYRLIVRFHEVD